ncbi:MAG: glycerate kinase [Saprospiraceae bacterium]
MNKKIVVACDKFKGSLSAEEVCDSLKKGILQTFKQTEIMTFPLSDGGEGSLDILKKYLSLTKIIVKTIDPIGRRLYVEYGIDNEGQAYIETSKVCGLMLLEKDKQNPKQTSTKGLGLVVLDVLQRGVKKIHLFLGGSGTSDGGAGMLSGLGFDFNDKKGQSFDPNGGNLSEIDTINWPDVDLFNDVQFYSWCDVQIPLLGKNGSTYMFAEQKGAMKEDLFVLEGGMDHFRRLIEHKIEDTTAHLVKGAGSAGGLGFALNSVLGGKIGMGAAFFIKMTKVNLAINKADVVITGEGSLDIQSFKGKCVGEVIFMAKKNKKNCLVVCGINKLEKSTSLKKGISTVFTLVNGDITLDESIVTAKDLLYKKGKEIGIMFQKTIV